MLGLQEGTSSVERHKGDTRPKINYGIGIGKRVGKVEKYLPQEDH